MSDLATALFASQLVLAGVALHLAVGTWPRRSVRSEGRRLTFVAWSGVLAATLAVNALVFQLPAGWRDGVLLLRTTLLMASAVLLAAMIARLAERSVPRTLWIAMLVVAAPRLVLWVTTDLVYVSGSGVEGLPVYGPLHEVTAAPVALLAVAYMLRSLPRFDDAVERWALTTSLVVGLGTWSASLLVADPIASELLMGLWIAPFLVGFEVVRARREGQRNREAQEHFDTRGRLVAELEDQQHRHRLALQAGEMGGFEFDAVSGQILWSAEVTRLEVFPDGRPASVRRVLDATHPDDRAPLAAWRTAVLDGDVVATEFRIPQPDGTVRWLEVHGRRTGEHVVGVIRDVTARRAAEDELRHRARHDELTGLANRSVLRRRLETFAGDGGVGGLLLLDLDRFKDINDAFGHPLGDAVLVAVADRLRGSLRSDDLLVRLGGDEFAVVTEGTDGQLDALAERLVGVLAQPLEVDGVEVTVGVSIGMVRVPQHGTEPDELLRRADLTMYAAKAGGGGWRTHVVADEQGTARRIELMGQIRESLDRGGGFDVHFQPKLDLVTGQVPSVEALARWSDREGRPVSPSEFVPWMESHGIGDRLAQRVLTQVLGSLRGWRDQGLDLTVAVNVSPRTLRHPGFVEDTLAVLRAADVPNDRLLLEITEDALAGEVATLRRVLDQLREHGIRLAIDDYGTGYASISHLRRFPVDEVKLDRSFTIGMLRDPRDAAIVRSTIALAHELGYEVVAEGVEDEAVLHHLRDLGCDLAQGYHIRRPAPADDLTAWLCARARAPVTVASWEPVADAR